MKIEVKSGENRNKKWTNNKDDFTPGQHSNIGITESLASV